ncbi:MAG: (2Fe-2S)-binding protein [Syntrophomonas sp.]|nr:(2Fe-2S)-binding protein [Syntrophomonas sp.]
MISDVCGTNPLDQQAQRCPICGEQGKKVRIETLENIIKADRLPITLEGYFLCLANKCNVIYFGQQIFYKDDVKVKVWFKEEESSVPVCYCTDVTGADIFEHIAIRKCCTDIEDIQKHTGANTGRECLTKNPAGT